MPSSGLGHRQLHAVLGLLFVLGLVGSSLALLRSDDSRAVAERFVHALSGDAGGRADEYLVPDAQVFLHGATTALSPAEFRAYLDQLKRSRHALHAASPVYVGEGGAGWLLEIKNLSETAMLNSPGIEQLPQLWMEARIGDNHITRLWVHFTVEALARLHVPPEVYRASAERQDTPVPEAWQDGTAAMLQAAQRRDPRAAGVWSESARPALMLAAWAPLVTALGVAGARSLRRRHKPSRSANGQLLVRLAQVHSAALRVRSGGLDEPVRLALRRWGATDAADLDHASARGFRLDTPASVDDNLRGTGAPPQREATSSSSRYSSARGAPLGPGCGPSVGNGDRHAGPR